MPTSVSLLVTPLVLRSYSRSHFYSGHVQVECSNPSLSNGHILSALCGNGHGGKSPTTFDLGKSGVTPNNAFPALMSVSPADICISNKSVMCFISFSNRYLQYYSCTGMDD